LETAIITNECNFATASGEWVQAACFPVEDPGVYFVNFAMLVSGSGRICLRNNNDSFSAVECHDSNKKSLSLSAAVLFGKEDYIIVLVASNRCITFDIKGQIDIMRIEHPNKLQAITSLGSKESIAEYMFGRQTRNLDI